MSLWSCWILECEPRTLNKPQESLPWKGCPPPLSVRTYRCHAYQAHGKVFPPSILKALTMAHGCCGGSRWVPLPFSLAQPTTIEPPLPFTQALTWNSELPWHEAEMCGSRAPFAMGLVLSGLFPRLNLKHLQALLIASTLWCGTFCSADNLLLPWGLLQLEGVPFLSYTIFRGLCVGLKKLLFGAISVH